MKIDSSKVNLVEKDIEDWLYENPDALTSRYHDHPITKWIGRQYALPSGIADLIGIRDNGMLVVVEVKNVAINKAAVLQVCRYQHDLKYIVGQRMDYLHVTDGNEPIIEMILVGPTIDDQTFTEAQAVNVQVFRFDVSLSLYVGCLDWDRNYRDRLHDQQVKIAARPEWNIYGLTITEDIEQHLGNGYVGSSDHFNEIAGIAREYTSAQISDADQDEDSDI
jgi:hypothetical protein